MIDPETRAEYESVTAEAEALLARVGAAPAADRGLEGRETPASAGTVSVVSSPALSVATIAGLALAAGAAALIIGNDTAQVLFAVGAVVLALLAAVLVVLAYAKANSIPVKDFVDVIKSLEGLVGKLMSKEDKKDLAEARRRGQATPQHN